MLVFPDLHENKTKKCFQLNPTKRKMQSIIRNILNRVRDQSRRNPLNKSTKTLKEIRKTNPYMNVKEGEDTHTHTHTHTER
jgi:hypothetical protein